MKMSLFIVAGAFLANPVVQAELRLGIEPRVSTAETERAFGPLAAHLAAEIGEPVRIVVPESFASFGRAVEAREFDLAFAAPATILHHPWTDEDRVNRVAMAVDRQQGPSLRGIFVAPSGSPLKGIRDLKGKRIAFVDKSSQGYLILSQLLREAGLDPRRDIRAEFHGKLDVTIQALLDGKADAAGVGDVIFSKLKDKVDLTRLKTIATSPPVPNWTVVGFDSKIAGRVRPVLLKLERNSPVANNVLGASHFAAFQTVDSDELARLRRAGRAHRADE